MSLNDSAAVLRAMDAQLCESEDAAMFFSGDSKDGVARQVRVGANLVVKPGLSVFDQRILRAFDILFALAVLAAVTPVVLLLICALQLGAPGPVFFVQQRIGRNAMLFPCIKLRTMVVDAEERLQALLEKSPEALAEWQADHKLKSDPRITKVGRFARRFSLDELPQLVNILLGHMSVVGPRPIVEEEVWRYGPLFADYCSVAPGLTGLWQVSGRNNTTYEERVKLDSIYAKQKSLVYDLKIIWRTIAVVAVASGAY